MIGWSRVAFPWNITDSDCSIVIQVKDAPIF